MLAQLARRGAQVVNFDNVDEAVIGGDVLEGCISAREDFEFRILGKIESLILPWRTVVFATADNATWSSGMDRRVLHLRLESPFERPESRPLDSYGHPERAGFDVMFQYALDHRAELVHAAMTLVRAYCAAGRPAPLTVGTFEQWAKLVPSAIVWSGGADPMLCRPAQSGEETPDQTFGRVLVQQGATWCRAGGGDLGASAAQVVAALYPPKRRDEAPATPDGWDDFRGAVEHFLPQRPGQVPAGKDLAELVRHKFKKLAVRTADAPAPLQRLVATGLTHGRVRWRVEDVGGGAQAAAAGPAAAVEPGGVDDFGSY